MPSEFLKCLQAAATHLDKQAQGGLQSWTQAQKPTQSGIEHIPLVAEYPP